MNSMQLKDKIRNISKEKNVDFNTVLRLYMYDRFLERLSKSKYRDNIDKQYIKGLKNEIDIVIKMRIMKAVLQNLEHY